VINIYYVRSVLFVVQMSYVLDSFLYNVTYDLGYQIKIYDRICLTHIHFI
jgi:hypothetical protein